jgi:glycosyltransferase involved in cell wall biosynthesis
MKISLVTPSFNQGQFLEETLHSVLDQRYPNLEYVIIDGGSTDESIEIIKRYEKHLTYWVSEPDRGQVDAINKGLAKATGDIVAYLNSDDLYLPGAFQAVVKYFQEHPDCDWLCGDTVMFGEDHATEIIHATVPLSAAHCLSWAYKAPQPAMFWKRELLKSGFDERWRYCFDHDLYVRLLLEGHQCDHLPLPLAAYRLHGCSKTVAESGGFDKEFDEIAEHYEAKLRGAERRWSMATRFLRRSYGASQVGNLREATIWLLKALLKHPESLRHRPFWGCLKRVLKTVTTP